MAIFPFQCITLNLWNTPIDIISSTTFKTQKISSFVNACPVRAECLGFASSHIWGSFHHWHQCEQNRVSAAVQPDLRGCEKWIKSFFRQKVTIRHKARKGTKGFFSKKFCKTNLRLINKLLRSSTINILFLFDIN